MVPIAARRLREASAPSRGTRWRTSAGRYATSSSSKLLVLGSRQCGVVCPLQPLVTVDLLVVMLTSLGRQIAGLPIGNDLKGGRDGP